MRFWQKVILCSLLVGNLLGTANVWAISEFGISGSVRNSTLNENTYNNTISLTGSLSWYFLEMSAIEFSYTNGSKKDSYVRVGDTYPEIIRTTFEMYGLDLVFSFAGREDYFQPFIKGGVAKVKNLQYQKQYGFSEALLAEVDGTAPSAGVGFRINLTKTFNFKCGVDAWYSPTNSTKKTIDYAGRAGISWFL